MKLHGDLSKCLVILFFLTPISGVQASDPPLSIIGLSTAESRLFIQSTVLTLAYYEFELRIEGKSRLYCLPKNNPVDGQLFWQMASNELTGPHEKDIVIVAAIRALKAKYPCDK